MCHTFHRDSLTNAFRIAFRALLWGLALPGLLLTVSSCASQKNWTEPYGQTGFQDGEWYRAWDIHVPLNAEGPLPLIIDFHGWSSTPRQQRNISGFRQLADSEHFIVVWPYGLQRSWNSGEACCPPANEEGYDDVAFIRHMIQILLERYPAIDSSRIYVTGLSNGASMAQRMAAEASDLVAACACMSFYLMTEPDDQYTPVPIMEFHGTRDRTVPYAATKVTTPAGDVLILSAERNFMKWKAINGCTSEDQITWQNDSSLTLTSTNEEGIEVALTTIHKGRHHLYRPLGTWVDTTRLAWHFLSRYQKIDGRTVRIQPPQRPHPES